MLNMRLITLFIVALGLQLGGCAVLTQGSNAPQNLAASEKPVVPEALIARDFVNALRQLPVVSPATTTVDLLQSARNDVFTQAMENALDEAGYGSRWISDGGSRMLFQYRKDSEGGAASSSQDIYEMAVGKVELRRSYVTDASNRVRPLSPLYVRGTDASHIVLRDEIFGQADDNQKRDSANIAKDPATVQTDQQQVARVHAAPLRSVTQIRNTPTQSLGLHNSSALRVPSDANPLNALVANSSGERTVSLPLITLPREQNVFELGGSNFEDILAGRVTVVEQVLTFANDSMRLGNRNKLLVEQLVQRFNPETDVFSVIGCSMGPTQVRGGNAALALGRAGRVVEALRFAGVDNSQIFDEGCWAGDGSLENLPRRGVVISLNRKA